VVGDVGHPAGLARGQRHPDGVAGAGAGGRGTNHTAKMVQCESSAKVRRDDGDAGSTEKELEAKLRYEPAGR